MWKEREEKFAKEITSWVAKNLGKTAKDHLLDMSVFTPAIYISQRANPEQKEKLFWLDKVCQNIVNLVQDLVAGVQPAPDAAADHSSDNDNDNDSDNSTRAASGGGPNGGGGGVMGSGGGGGGAGSTSGGGGGGGGVLFSYRTAE